MLTVRVQASDASQTLAWAQNVGASVSYSMMPFSNPDQSSRTTRDRLREREPQQIKRQSSDKQAGRGKAATEHGYLRTDSSCTTDART